MGLSNEWMRLAEIIILAKSNRVCCQVKKNLRQKTWFNTYCYHEAAIN